MLPSIVQKRVDLAKAEAHNLRETAIENPQAPVMANRLLSAAHTIEEISALLEQTTFVAQLNHDTIVARARR